MKRESFDTSRDDSLGIFSFLIGIKINKISDRVFITLLITDLYSTFNITYKNIRMNFRSGVLICLAVFACGLCSNTVHGLGVSNFTTAEGVVTTQASGSLVLTPPTNQDNVGEIVLYVFSIDNILGLTSAQILQDGEIVAELVPTNTEIDNADYAGIITYSESEDPNPLSDVELTTIDGVEVSQYKSPGYTGSTKISSSIDNASLLGPMEGKTMKEFEAALAAGNLTVIVRTEAYKNGELVGDITSKSVPAPVPVKKEVVSSSRMTTMVGGVMAGVAALFI